MALRMLLDLIFGVTRGEPLESTLDSICRLIQAQQPDAICTAMLFDPVAQKLNLVAGPSLNARARAILSKLTPASDGGSCAAAFYLKQSVVVADTRLDPHWQSARGAATELGVRSCWSVPFFGSDGAPVGTFAISRPEPGSPSPDVLQTLQLGADIAGLATRQLRASQAAAKVNRFREAIIQTASEGICVCNAVAEQPFVRFSLWNERMTQITGYTIDEINAAGWYQSLYPDPDLQRRAIERMDRMRHGDNLLGEEWEITRKDGQQRTISISTSAVETDEGQPTVVAMMQDVSDRKLLQWQLFHAQKLELVGRLAGGVAHDFNNLLTALLGNVDIASSSINDPVELEYALREIRGVADRASRLTRQLLMLAKQEQIKPETININEQIRSAQRLLQRVLGDAVRLDLQFDPQLWNSRIDLGQFSQIIVNLAVNARDAMSGGGEFRMRTENVTVNDTGGAPPAGDYVLLTVSDTGEGMTPEVARRIFEPFFTTKHPDRGTGLGLSTVQEIVNQASGYILVETLRGSGTTFRIYLPRCDGRATHVNGDHKPPVRIATSAVVLVVEDNDAVRSVIVAALERAGCQVIEASCGDEALRVLDRRGDQIRMMITDLLMPQMDGRTLIERVRRVRPGLPVMLMSGNVGDTNFGPDWHELRIPFIAKPFSADDLSQRVAALLEESVANPT
ncbi:MAG: ATP-binding protein [Phycisphaerae bacterium]